MEIFEAVVDELRDSYRNDKYLIRNLMNRYVGDHHAGWAQHCKKPQC